MNSLGLYACRYEKQNECEEYLFHGFYHIGYANIKPYFRVLNSFSMSYMD